MSRQPGFAPESAIRLSTWCWKRSGLTAGRHQPHTLDELEDDYFDLIVTLAPEAHHAALELTRSMAIDVVYWPTPDPTVATGTREQIVSAYRDVRNHIATLLKHRLLGQMPDKMA